MVVGADPDVKRAVLGTIEDHIQGAKQGSVGAGARLLTGLQEEAECNTNHVGNGMQEVTGPKGVVGALHYMVQNGNRNMLHMVGRWVLLSNSGPSTAQTEILFARGGPIGVQGPQNSKHLANGMGWHLPP